MVKLWGVFSFWLRVLFGIFSLFYTSNVHKTNTKRFVMTAKALILAAGAGTRMKSSKPKVAHEVLGKPLVRWVVDAAHAAGIDEIVSILGHQADQVAPLVEADTKIAIQSEQLGTGHAVNCGRSAVAEEDGSIAPGSLVVLSGDCPLITPATIAALIDKREATGAAVVVLTMQMDNPFGYGRIVREGEGDAVARIVEQKDASPEEAAICECNAGFYCFDAPALFDALSRVSNDNAQGEYYLTDCIGLLVQRGERVEALLAQDGSECLGVNSPEQLDAAAAVMEGRLKG